MNERRKFLVQSVAALGAVGLGWRTPPAEGAAAAVGSERFKSYVNQSFTVYDARTGTRARMKLREVRLVPSGPKLDQFSLVFQARPGVTLGEGRYRVVGGPARRSELFMTPVPGRGDTTTYRADFSLLV
jgi:hypothetical protein